MLIKTVLPLLFVTLPLALAAPISSTDVNIAAREEIPKDLSGYINFAGDSPSESWADPHDGDFVLPVQPDAIMRRDGEPTQFDKAPFFAHLKPHTHIPADLMHLRPSSAEDQPEVVNIKVERDQSDDGIARIRHWWDRPNHSSGAVQVPE